MAARHVVVDGSNLATEGRSMPSLAQLDQAVREFLTENPDDVVTVVVDASFGHRIESSELKMFEEAEEAGELVSPPAGAIGRGDAFLLRIADKTGATVLSNDSFQEFHGDYDWLFERGRLIGGKPVPGVGWIFTPRTPVRGPRSREAVKEAKRKTTKQPESAKPGLDLAAERSRAKGQGKGKKNVERAIAVALEEAVAPKDKPHRRRKGGSPPADPVNNPLTFITFIAAHPLGAEVTGTVESFASHGAFVDCEGARCYVPLSAMGNPPPKSAREIFTKGQEVSFVVQALDPLRRGVELAVPGFAKIAGAPTEETVAAEIEGHADDEAEAPAPAATPAPARRTRKKSAPPEAPSEPAPSAAVRKAAPRRRAAKASADGGPEVGANVDGATPAGAASLQAARRQTPVPAGPADGAAVQAGSQPPAPGARTARRRVASKESVAGPPEGSVSGTAAEAVGAEAVGAAVAEPAPAPAPARRAPRRRAPSVAPEESVEGPAAGVDGQERGPAPVADGQERGPAPVVRSSRRRGSRAAPGELAEAVPAPDAEAPLPPVGPRKRRPPSTPPAGADQPAPGPPPTRARRGRAPVAEAAEPVTTPEPAQTTARARRGRAGASPAAPAPAVESAPATPDPVPAAVPATAPATAPARRRRAPAPAPDEST